MAKQKRSEFGRGLVICLVKFAEHYEGLFNDSVRYKFMSEPSAIQMHFNAASDHLYDIKLPPGWNKQYPKLHKMVKGLQGRALQCGHGPLQLTKTEAYDLHKLSREIALEIDSIIGLKPDMGDW